MVTFLDFYTIWQHIEQWYCWLSRKGLNPKNKGMVAI